MTECELFVKGIEKVERQRYIIAQTIETIIKLLGNCVMPWKREKIVITVPLGDIGDFLLTSKKKRLERPQLIWPTYGQYCDLKQVPHRTIPVIFNRLSEILKITDGKFPEARIKECFNFYIEQASM